MFAELSGYEANEIEVEAGDAGHRAHMVENVRRWRAANPARWQAQRRKQVAAYFKRHPEKALAKQRRRRERDRAKMRAVWNRNARAYRARKKASAS